MSQSLRSFTQLIPLDSTIASGLGIHAGVSAGYTSLCPRFEFRQSSQNDLPNITYVQHSHEALGAPETSAGSIPQVLEGMPQEACREFF